MHRVLFVQESKLEGRNVKKLIRKRKHICSTVVADAAFVSVSSFAVA